MLKSLNVLIRIQQHQVDEKRRSLANLLNQISNLEENDNSLKSEMMSEQVVANSAPDGAGMYYGRYVQKVVSDRRDIANKIRGIEDEVILAQEEIRDAYKDLKVVEITLEKLEKAFEMENAKSEQNILDEIGQETYRRRKI